MAFKKLKLWFDKDLAIMLADKLLVENPSFDKKKYVKHIDKVVAPLELKDRVEVMADAFVEYLGNDYTKTLPKLVAILGPENQEETGMFNNFYWVMPIAKYIEKYGLDHLDISLSAIEEVTKRNTGEYTIRPFIERYPEKVMKQMLKWSKDKNRHVRRLASEGGRPRLPWASKLDLFIDDPKPLLPILENLKNDPSKYVQKSVANCINDILKDNLELAKELLEKWSKGNVTKERQWIIKHSLRNLIKKEDPWALKIIEVL